MALNKRTEYSRTWRTANKERNAEYCRTYARVPANKRSAKARDCKHKGIPFDLPVEFFETVPSHCPHCGVEFLPVGTKGGSAMATIDRDDPALGYVIGNCEWLCQACNRRKQDQSWDELFEFAQRGRDRVAGVRRK